MTDITSSFDECLKERGGTPVVKQTVDIHRINSFLEEAYNINARISDLTNQLRAIRPAYLSTAPARRRHLSDSHNPNRQQPLLDSERDAFDAESKQLLRQLNGAITNLKQAEEVRLQTAEAVAISKRAKGGLGAIGRWAAGGAVTAKSVDEEREESERNMVAAHRNSVLLFLQLGLERASRVQSEMLEVRHSRELEKTKSALYKTRVSGGIPYSEDLPAEPASGKRAFAAPKRQSAPTDDDPPPSSATRELSPEQLQLFAEENADLLKHYEGQLDQVRSAEKSILEISELHSTLHANLQQQSEHIDQLVQDSYLTTENLGKGNKELKKASERRSTAQAVFWGTVGFCSFLVVWDLVF